MSPSHPSLLVAGVAALALVVGACGGGDPGGAGAGGANAPGGAATITIDNFEYRPPTLEAKVGDTVTVVNKDTAEHTVTAEDGSFDTGRFASGTKTITLTRPGRFEYVCTVHPFMTHAFIQVSG